MGLVAGSKRSSEFVVGLFDEGLEAAHVFFLLVLRVTVADHGCCEEVGANGGGAEGRVGRRGAGRQEGIREGCEGCLVVVVLVAVAVAGGEEDYAAGDDK